MRRSFLRGLRRVLPRTAGEIAAVVCGIVGLIIEFLIKAFESPSAWPWVALTALGVIAVTIVLYRAISTGQTPFFEPISFGELRDSTVIGALHGLLNYEKARPDFVHAAPQNKEVDVLLKLLTRSGFATLHGGPGEGKSMTAYHVACRLHSEKGYSPYKLRLDLLAGRFSEFSSQVLEQIDRLKGERKIIIVDDAQKLSETAQLNQLMRDESSDSELKVLWLETEFYEDAALFDPPEESHVKIDFKSFVDQLVANLYRSRDGLFQNELRGQIEGLDEAISKAARNEIRDAWHFAFVASRGEERIGAEISRLDNAEILVLFLVSAHTVISGEEGLSVLQLTNILETLGFAWLRESLRKRSLIDVIRSLEEYKVESHPDGRRLQRISLIRRYDKTAADRGYIASLHYNCARAILEAALLRKAMVDYLLGSLKTLLVSDHRRSVYLGTLLRCLGPGHAPAFVNANERWFVDFLNNPPPEMLGSCSSALVSLKRCNAETWRATIQQLDLESIARSAGAIQVDQFSSLGALLSALGNRRDDFIEKVSWKELARQVSKAEATQFQQVSNLLDNLRERRNELAEKVAWQDLAARVAKADVRQLQQVGFLLSSIEHRRNELLDGLSEKDWQDLALRMGTAEVDHFGQVAGFLNALGQRRDHLLGMIAWQSLASRVAGAPVSELSQIRELLEALGDRTNAERREQFVRLADWDRVARTIAETAEVTDLQMLSQLLIAMGTQGSSLGTELGRDGRLLRLATRIAQAPSTMFEAIAVFLRALKIPLPPTDISSLVDTASKSGSENLKGLTMLMASLDEERRNQFLLALDWTRLCQECPIKVGMLGAFGSCLENVVKKEKLSPNVRGSDQVRDYLRDREAEIVRAVEESYTQAEGSRFYSGIAKLLYNCCEIDEVLAFQITEMTIGAVTQDFKVTLSGYRNAGQLINAFYKVYPDVGQTFVENPKVIRRIASSLNRQDWTNRTDGLEHLIMALYRASPTAWFEILAAVGGKLEGIDLDALYEEVTRSPVVGEPLEAE